MDSLVNSTCSSPLSNYSSPEPDLDWLNDPIEVPLYETCGWIKDGVLKAPTYQVCDAEQLYDILGPCTDPEQIFSRLDASYERLNDSIPVKTRTSKKNLQAALDYIKTREFLPLTAETPPDIHSELIVGILLALGFDKKNLYKAVITLDPDSSTAKTSWRWNEVAIVQHKGSFFVLDPVVHDKILTLKEWTEMITGDGPFDCKKPVIVAPNLHTKYEFQNTALGVTHTVDLFVSYCKYVPPKSHSEQEKVCLLGATDQWIIACDAYYYKHSFPHIKRFQDIAYKVIDNLQAQKALQKLEVFAHTSHIHTMGIKDFDRWWALVNHHFSTAIKHPLTEKKALSLENKLFAKRAEYANSPLVPFYQNVGYIENGTIVTAPRFVYCNLKTLAEELGISANHDILSNTPNKRTLTTLFRKLQEHYETLFSDETCKTKVTEENLQAAFDHIKELVHIISWNHVKNGCGARAKMTACALSALGFRNNQIKLIAMNLNPARGWGYHTAAAVLLSGDDFSKSKDLLNRDLLILDVPFDNKSPMTLTDWIPAIKKCAPFDDKECSIIAMKEDGPSTVFKEIPNASHVVHLFENDYFYNPGPNGIPGSITRYTPKEFHFVFKNTRNFLDESE